jgi:RimJ/RimL family protein N-acetyltransferase
VHPLETERLTLRRLQSDDAPFIVELLNSPTWLEFIGDRGIRTTDDAQGYIERAHVNYALHGFSLYLVALRDGTRVGLCGPIRREGLNDVDLGFALLPTFAGRGYALEAARRVVEHARVDLKLGRVAGITVPENARSIRLLEALGMRREGSVRLSPDDVELNYYAMAL